MKNKIWIELVNPFDIEMLNVDVDVFANEQCELANKVLAKLAPQSSRQFSWLNNGRQPARYHYGDEMGTTELVDNGHWFNLDYIAK